MMNPKVRQYYVGEITKILAGFTGFCLLAVTWFVVMVTTSESYCAVMPSIDTRFAPGFTEAKFDRVQVGMDSIQVRAILGVPYSTYHFESGRMWAYTGDGGAWWLALDFAWLGREIAFDEAGKVTCCIRHIYYD